LMVEMGRGAKRNLMTWATFLPEVQPWRVRASPRVHEMLNDGYTPSPPPPPRQSWTISPGESVRHLDCTHLDRIELCVPRRREVRHRRRRGGDTRGYRVEPATCLHCAASERARSSGAGLRNRWCARGWRLGKNRAGRGLSVSAAGKPGHTLGLH
jgi:hypothetical protein